MNTNDDTAPEHGVVRLELEARLVHASAHPALEATSALIRKMLVQTGRSHVARAPDDRTLCALEVPARLWRALGEAGPCPKPQAPLDLSVRWWLVETEHPGDDDRTRSRCGALFAPATLEERTDVGGCVKARVFGEQPS